MHVRQLAIAGAWEFTPAQHRDDRGVFLEWFTETGFMAATQQPLRLAQANCSVSRAGTLRGVHFADVPPGQAKYVTCLSGAVLDVVVDIRVGSPTFGMWDGVRLDDLDRRAVYLSEGLGHAFLALTEGAVVTYLCSEGYAPSRERGINPLDPDIGITWPTDVAPLLSPKDAAAPTLGEAQQAGLLPTYAACRAYRAQLGP